MQLTLNKLTTTKSMLANLLNVPQNTNSEKLKLLMPPLSSEIHLPNLTPVKPKKLKLTTNLMSMNNKLSLMKNTWESSSLKEMLKNLSSKEDPKILLTLLELLKKLKIFLPPSTPEVDHSLKFPKSPRKC